MGIPAEGFLRHKGLILVAAGGAVAEAGLLTLLAPSARPVAPQITALPALAAYHDLRWLFTDSQSWLGFAAVMVATLLARSAVDTVLLRLAWPREEEEAPTVSRTFWSCLALTALAWLLLSPAATLAFGVAVLPFSWPFIAALPIMLGTTLALGHGGAVVSWWHRLPPPRSMLWLFFNFVMLSAAAAVIAHLPAAAALAVAAVAGLVNARTWYGIAAVASRLHSRTPASMPARVLLGLPFAPLAAIMVLALVVGVARLMFTGTIQLPAMSPGAAAANAADSIRSGAAAAGGAKAAPAASTVADAVLVVAGWGSSCCDAGNALRAVAPGIVVRQFSYTGLTAAGQPLRSGPNADDLPLPMLGDRIAAQLMRLHDLTHRPVDIIAESEGTLGAYAMLDRHPGLPIGSVVLLSPIVEPGQMSYSPDLDGTSVSEYALDELNHLVGGMSPYGASGAKHLLSSVSQFGARYFDHLARADDGAIRWLTVVPLADALTLPVCGLPPNAFLVPAFHGGLLGDSGVLPMVASFLTGHSAVPKGQDEGSLRAEAELITGAAVAWRMPETGGACP